MNSRNMYGEKGKGENGRRDARLKGVEHGKISVKGGK